MPAVRKLVRDFESVGDGAVVAAPVTMFVFEDAGILKNDAERTVTTPLCT